MGGTFLKKCKMVALFLALSGCAAIKAPDGGPRDTEGPHLQAVSPAHLSTGQQPRHIVFRFDEYLDAGTAQAAVHVSPVPRIAPQVWIKNRRLHLQLRDTLLPNTTYVVTVSDALKDYHEKNALARPLTYAFSTGQQVDSAYISGHLHDAYTGKASTGFTLLLYPADSVTDGYLGRRPLYAAQTDGTGAFTLGYLRPGRYRLLGVNDRDHSYTYNQANEAIATLPDNLFVIDADSSAWHARLTTFTPDAQPPRVLNVLPSGPQAVKLRLSEKITQAKATTSLRITDSRGVLYEKDTLDYLVEKELTTRLVLQPEPALLLALPLPWKTGDSLKLRLNLTDTAGNTADTLLTVAPDAEWPFAAKRTDKPRLEPADHPLALRLELPGPIDTATLARATLAYRRPDLATDPLPTLSWQAHPLSPTVIFSHYVGDSVLLSLPPHPLWGDSVYVLRLRLADPEGLATLQVPLATATPLSVQLLIEGKPYGPPRALAAGSHTLTWNHLPPKNAALLLVEDRDGNGLWTTGSLLPYRAPEPLYRTPDFPPLRANWEVIAPQVVYPPAP